VTELEARTNLLRDEALRFEEMKNEFHKKLLLEQEEFDRIQLEKERAKELIPLLEKRRDEIERGNYELENRFAKMFQKFNAELNDITTKRTVLEQIVSQKEKEIEEKDKQILEKVAALEESERILNMRQTEIDSFEQLLKTIEEKKELLQNELLKLDQEVSERKNTTNDLKLENDLLIKKKISIEQGLQEILNSMNQRLTEAKEKRSNILRELQEAEARFEEMNSKISDSMDELVELQTSISMIKVEHEEHRNNVMKLASMKKKLQEEIAKNQKVLQRYQKIREKLKIEQSILKNRQESLVNKSSNKGLSEEKHDNETDNKKIYKL
jgi:chromosome segregation protein